MASTAGSVPAFLLKLLGTLHVLALRATAETLQLSFGTSSATAGYEVASAASMFAQWSGGTKYFGSCFGGHWVPFGGASDEQSDGSALGTWSKLASGTFFCLLNVPAGSYQQEVIAGNTPAQSSTCLELPDGSQVLQSTMPSGTTSTGTAVIHETTAGSVCIKACAADSVINVWTIQRLSCHVSCAFCTGASSSACALSCNEGRTLVSRDGGSYCDERVPYAPGGPATSAVTDEGATLTWSQPLSGGSGITGYRIEVAVGTATVFTELVANTHSSAISFQVTGLAGGESYRFVVAGINGVGVGDSSPPSVSITTLPSSPDPPAAAWIENITSSSMAVYWSEPAKDGGRPITMYTVQIAENNETFHYVLNTSLLACVLTSLQGATTYRIRVIAENEIGLSEPRETDDAVSQVTQSPVVPLPPSITALSMNAPYQATLSWMAPEDHGGSPVIKYTVSVGLSVGDVEPVANIEAGSDPLHAQIGRLLGSTSYAFQVAAVNIVGTSDAARIVAMTPAPTQAAAPGVPLASNIGQNFVDLTWAEPAHDGGSQIIGYRIRVAVHGLWSIITDCNSTCDNSTTIPDLEGNTGYQFALQALTAFGPGFQSGISTVIFTTEVPPFQPGKPWAREVQQHQVVLVWDAPANDGGLDLIGYKIWKRSGVALDWIVVTNSTGSNDTSMLLQGLEGNTQYRFMIAGSNSLGIGHVSMSDPIITLPTPPGALDAPIIENGDAWTSVSDCNNSCTNATVSDCNNSCTNATTLTGLSGMPYRIRVAASNETGSSVPSAVSSATTLPPRDPQTAFHPTSNISSIPNIMTVSTHQPTLTTTRSLASMQTRSFLAPIGVPSTTTLASLVPGAALSSTSYANSIPNAMTVSTDRPALTTTRGQNSTNVTTSVRKMGQTTSTTQEVVEGTNLNTPARITEDLLSPSTTPAKNDACPFGMAIDGLQCVTECTARGEVLVLRGVSSAGLACEARAESSRPARVAFTFSRSDPFPVDLVERLLRAVASASAAAGASGIRFGVTEVTSGNVVQNPADKHPGG